MRIYDGAHDEARATRQVLAYVLEQSLRLLHPFMPFVTEEIWQSLPAIAQAAPEGRALIVTRWPVRAGHSDPIANESFGRIQEIVRAVRNARSEYEVEPGKRIPAHFAAGEYAGLLAASLPLLANLARVDAGTAVIATELPPPDKSVTLAVGGVTVYLPLAGWIYFAAERQRLNKEIDNIDKQTQRIEGLLGNEGFTAKAPADLIARERAKLIELTERRGQLSDRLVDLSDA